MENIAVNIVNNNLIFSDTQTNKQTKTSATQKIYCEYERIIDEYLETWCLDIRARIMSRNLKMVQNLWLSAIQIACQLSFVLITRSLAGYTISIHFEKDPVKCNSWDLLLYIHQLMEMLHFHLHTMKREW